MRRVRAWERLNDPEYGGRLTMTEFYDLCLEAGYNPKTAQKAASERGWNRLQAGVKM